MNSPFLFLLMRWGHEDEIGLRFPPSKLAPHSIAVVQFKFGANFQAGHNSILVIGFRKD